MGLSLTDAATGHGVVDIEAFGGAGHCSARSRADGLSTTPHAAVS
jgi:hypothetical protein